MLYTKIDCRYFSLPQSELKIPASFVTINPEAKPGSLVLAGSSAFSKSIGAQVACKLSLEHFIEGTLDFFKNPKEAEILPQQTLTQALLESAFRKANISVYEFGHKLSAGGRMAASLIGLVIKDNLVTAGRVGAWSAYLLRGGFQINGYYRNCRSSFICTR
jgi:hypothetical protein